MTQTTLRDDELLDLVQRQTLRYFWDFAHPVSGLARERSDVTPGCGPDVVTTGGTGFGIMAIIAGVERGWLDRAAASNRLLEMARFLGHAERHHGIFAHWLDGRTGRTVAFSELDDGADLVETSFLLMGLLTARQYFGGNGAAERELRERVDALWNEAEFDWHTKGDEDMLYWHWSERHGWAMNHPIRGWNECLVTYVLAASSRRHAVRPEAYHRGWAGGSRLANGRTYHGIRLPLGPDHGGPLFFAHYSFMGLDPRGLEDRYADYLEQNVAHTLINHRHCVANPNGHAGYGEACWGLTASDDPWGYEAHAPDRDRGVITPTAAIASMPYTPALSLAALRHFMDYDDGRLWTDMGFVDAFCPAEAWRAGSHLAIDQGPIVVMIENHRSGLLWRLFMSCPEIRDGLRRLGFTSPHLGATSA
ncbi:MAG: beta-glucosidase [Geminicoccaceae bacterium]|nr:beta-glucosidase [Geminicoccaceae bacterium]